MTKEEVVKWLESLKREIGKAENRTLWHYAESIDMAIEALSAEAVEVVRCKDCLMTKERDEYTNKIWCCRHREYMDDMYYCADGLRREDGEA